MALGRSIDTGRYLQNGSYTAATRNPPERHFRDSQTPHGSSPHRALTSVADASQSEAASSGVVVGNLWFSVPANPSALFVTARGHSVDHTCDSSGRGVNEIRRRADGSNHATDQEGRGQGTLRRPDDRERCSAAVKRKRTGRWARMVTSRHPWSLWKAGH